MKFFIVAAALAASLGSAVAADVNIQFLEGAPKDRFVLTNAGACDLKSFEVTLDLSTSASGVIFDVTGSGAGVEVFQPFQIVDGGKFVVVKPAVADGDRALTLKLNSLPLGKTVAFTVDVDDTSGGREITVNDNEIRGATASVQTSSWTVSETFGDKAVANVPVPACT